MSISQTALKYIGKVPYVLGAPTAAMGYATGHLIADCSSFAQFLCGQEGYVIPRTADEQYRATQQFAVSPPCFADDLLFFGGWNDPSNPPGYAGIQHVAISLGGDNLVQEGGGNAQYPSIENVNVGTISAYGSHFLYATRPFGEPMVPIKFKNVVGHATVQSTPSLRIIDYQTGRYRIPSKTDYDVYDRIGVGPGDVGQYANSVEEDAVIILDGTYAILLARNAVITYNNVVAPVQVPFTMNVDSLGKISFS
jgi:cell wall-associated NlpC family hydrolase